MMYDVQDALDEISSESSAPAISAILAISHLKLAGIARIAAKCFQICKVEFVSRLPIEDAKALLIHGPMSCDMTMRVLHWAARRYITFYG